jgi:hypothetical protein
MGALLSDSSWGASTAQQAGVAAKQRSDADVPDLLLAVRKDPRKVARIQVGRRCFVIRKSK